MMYRILGRTGLRVSELGLGGHEYRRPLPTTLDRWGDIDIERFKRGQPDRNILIKEAIGEGINYFDATQTEEAKSLGIALKELGLRERVHIAAMIISPFKRLAETPQSKWHDTILEGVEERLEQLQTSFIDVFNIHVPEECYSRDRLQATLQALLEMRDQEKIGWIGASSHEPGFLAELIRRYDCFNSVMVRYNYHLQEAREALFPICKALDIGVVTMKPFSWPYYGIPFFRLGPARNEITSLTPAQISLQWILSAPEVSTIVPGMNGLDELNENLAAITKRGEKIDEKQLEQYLKVARSPKAKERLRNMLKDSAIDIRHFACRALAEQPSG